MSIIPLPPSEVVLREWNIVELKGYRTRHFVGFSVYDNLGRLSTPIKEFDEASGEGLTMSGSTYSLKGDPGIVHPDALYVLNEETGYGQVKYEWVYPIPPPID